MKIYVGNLSYGVTDDELGDIFSEYGDVTSVSIIEDRDTGSSKRFAFVEMPNQPEAEEAIKNVNEKKIKSLQITCSDLESWGNCPSCGKWGKAEFLGALCPKCDAE